MCVVLSTAPPDQAQPLATHLVESGLAACVNLVPGVRSIYRYGGALCNDPETVLIIKCPQEARPALAEALQDRHSYEVPEIVALQVSGASGPYARWVAESGADRDDPNVRTTTA